MKQITHISIPNPCAQNWGDMLLDGGNRFCNHCQKSVADFSKLSDAEILEVLATSANNVCGRFTKTQLLVLNDHTVPQYEPVNRWQKMRLTALFVGVVPFINVPAKASAPVEQRQPEVKKVALVPDSGSAYKTIKGRITDTQNEVLQGVLVKVKGTQIFTYTSMGGDFVISVPAKSEVTLVAVYIGFRMQEIKINPNETAICNFKMQESQMLLGEVVIVKRPPVYKRPWYSIKRLYYKLFR